ncbi:hypothetical protein CoNPh25_CDS0041 [Staphylococcus phage S-CoN_Ph25]|nr:hypothetical protein CoNPh25_CDS0041 [Staphylococcus phage S-CoN_Ph25]
MLLLFLIDCLGADFTSFLGSSISFATGGTIKCVKP